MLEVLLCCKRHKDESTRTVTFKRLIIILFVLIALVDLVILSYGVYNDKPTITRVYSPTSQFPVPGEFN
jgi:hypothetical protein